jgi:hypothetical protein
MTAQRLRSGAASVLTLIVSGTLLAALPASPPATAARAPVERPVVHAYAAAERDGHFPSSISATVPAGGTLMVTSPNIGRTATSIMVTVAADDDENDLDFSLIAHFVAKRKSPGQRLLACVALTQAKLAGWDGFVTNIDLIDENKSKALLFLDTCLRLARLIQQIEAGTRAAPVTPAVAATRCQQGANQFPAKEEKVAGGFRLTISGTPSKAKKNGGFKIKCQASPGKVVYTLRSRKRGQTLQKLLGPQVALGLYSPLGATASVPVTVTFGKPR